MPAACGGAATSKATLPAAVYDGHACCRCAIPSHTGKWQPSTRPIATITGCARMAPRTATQRQTGVHATPQQRQQHPLSVPLAMLKVVELGPIYAVGAPHWGRAPPNACICARLQPHPPGQERQPWALFDELRQLPFMHACVQLCRWAPHGRPAAADASKLTHWSLYLHPAGLLARAHCWPMRAGYSCSVITVATSITASSLPCPAKISTARSYTSSSLHNHIPRVGCRSVRMLCWSIYLS